MRTVPGIDSQAISPKAPHQGASYGVQMIRGHLNIVADRDSTEAAVFTLAQTIDIDHDCDPRLSAGDRRSTAGLHQERRKHV
jgi:hypothetical protein